MKRYFEGEEAREIGATVHNILLDFARAMLNDAPRPARLVDYPLINVTQSLDKAIDCYEKSAPFLMIAEGPYSAEFARLQTDTGVLRGQCHQMSFLLDMALAGKAEAESNPVKTTSTNRRLRDAVRDGFQRGYFALKELGVTLIEDSFQADAERQRDPSTINPHRFTVEVFSLD